MASATLNAALALVVFASAVDCHPVPVGHSGRDTSVDTATCKVILDEGHPRKDCNDERYTVEWLDFVGGDFATISVSFEIRNGPRFDTSLGETKKCYVEAAAGSTKACGDLGTVTWFHVSEGMEYAGTKTVLVKFSPW